MNMIALGFSIIACMFVWQYIWKRTALSVARDALFDLRDLRVRKWFIDNNVPLDDQIYKILRQLINGHLQHLESADIWWHIKFYAWCIRNPDVVKERVAQIDRLFETDNPELAKLANDVRKDATMIVVAYILETSVIMLALLGLVGACAIAYEVGKKLKSWLAALPYARIGITSKRAAAILCAIVISLPGFSTLRTRVPPRTTIEDCALHQSVPSA